MEIVALDIDGETAAVKVRDAYLGLRFIDYLTLIRIGGAWRVVHKAYRHD